MPAIDVAHTEYLRLHIVDLIGKQNSSEIYPPSRPGHGPKIIKLDQLDNTQKYRQHFNRLAMNAGKINKGPVKGSHQTNPRLDLDVTPAQTTPFPPQPPVTSATRTKNRAAAWLMKRFQKRQDGQPDSTTQLRQPKNSKPMGQLNGQPDSTTQLRQPKNSKPMGQLNGQDRIDAQSLHIGPDTCHQVAGQENVESILRPAADDRKSFSSNLASLKSEHEKLSHFTTLLLAKGSYENEAKSSTMNRNNRQNSANEIHLHRYNNNPKKDKASELNENNQNKDGGQPTRPRLSSLEKRSGIFSASLENFKRRLLLSTSKFSQILKEQLPRERLTTPDVKHCPPLQHLPRPPSQPTRPSSRHPPPPPPSADVTQPVGHGYQHIRRLDSRASNFGKATVAGTEGRKSKSEVKKPDNPVSADPPEISKFSYRLTDQNDVKQDTGNAHHQLVSRVELLGDNHRPGQVMPGKTTLPVQVPADVDRPAPTSSSRMAAQAPLTVHNIRLHESMQVAYERRMRRQTQHQRQLSTDSDSSTASAGDRMWQWLADVTVQSRPESEDPELQKHNTTPENVEIFV